MSFVNQMTCIRVSQSRGIQTTEYSVPSPLTKGVYVRIYEPVQYYSQSNLITSVYEVYGCMMYIALYYDHRYNYLTELYKHKRQPEAVLYFCIIYYRLVRSNINYILLFV